MFYGFLLNMWMMRKITEEQVHSYVPTYISEDEAKAILITPQEEI